MEAISNPQPHNSDPDANWRLYAACVGEEPEMFYPNKGQSVNAAKYICSSCIVQDSCLEEALRTEHTINDRFGVWGGLSRTERQEIADLRASAQVSAARQRIKTIREIGYRKARSFADGAARRAARS